SWYATATATRWRSWSHDGTPRRRDPPPRRRHRPHAQLEALGAIPGRAPVGNGARGLLARRHLLGLLSPRPRPEPRLPLGRGRAARPHRPRVSPLPRGRALERSRPDPEGAALRPHRPRGEPRDRKSTRLNSSHQIISYAV